MKKVMILFGKSDWKKAKPFSNKDYQYSYEYFYDLCQQNGIQMFRASYEWYDYEKNIFKHAWIFEGKGGNWKRVDDIKPDLVYDKTKARAEVYWKKELIGHHYAFINDLNFTKIIDNKLVTSLMFPEWSKKCWLIRSKAELDCLPDTFDSSKIVIKPISESGGEGVIIVEKNNLENVEINGINIVQGFIDSSIGVPGVSKKMHDLRLVFVNDKLVYAYIREPEDGNYLANLAQGGSLAIVPKEKLPRSLEPAIECVRNTFSAFENKIYAVDFMFDEKGKPWIVELNSMPGLFFTPEEKPYMMEMYEELLKVFKQVLFKK